jgi:uncharacterized membrane protein YsdA (DUF1294 family)
MQFSTEQVMAIFVLLLIATVVCWAVYWDYRTKAIRHDERKLMIEKGLTPPPLTGSGWPGVRQTELQLQYDERRLMIEKGITPPTAEKRALTAQDALRRGTLLSFFGAGSVAAYLTVPFVDREIRAFLGAAGFIVGLLGLGYLVYFTFVRKKDRMMS